MKYIRILLLAIFAAAAFQAKAQEIPRDEKAEQLVVLGKKYLSTGDYDQAAQTFILASQRPDNQQTSTVLYYLALSWYYKGEMENARRRFSQLLDDYPESRYADDARYHLALVNLASLHVNDKERGLDLMFRLADESKDEKMCKDAMNAARHYLHDVYDVKFLDLYFMFVKEKFRYVVLEATCDQLDRKGNGKQILANIKAYEEEGKTLTPWLADMKKKYSSTGAAAGGKAVSGGEVKIAICLGFYLNLVDTATVVPKSSQRALELYEGIRFSLEEGEGKPGPHFIIKVWDTRNDSNHVKGWLDELESFDPDMILGDISTSSSVVLSRWAEEHKTVQLVPRNPLDNLIEGRKFVFLFHPSQKTHGAFMGDYAKGMGWNRAYMVNDYTFNSDTYCKAFADRMRENSCTADEKRVQAKFDPYIKQVPSLAAGYNIIYCPLEGEENLGMLLSALNIARSKLIVTGPYTWEDVDIVDADSKTDAQLTYSTYFCEGNDSVALAEFRLRYVGQKQLPPTKYTTQGYDLMNYVMHIVSKESEGQPLGDVIRKAEKWHGLHQDVYFNGKQSNTLPSIVRFENGRIIKLK